MILLTPEEIEDIGKKIPYGKRYSEALVQAAVRKVAEWGFGVCPHEHIEALHKRECSECWLDLCREAGMEGI